VTPLFESPQFGKFSLCVHYKQGVFKSPHVKKNETRPNFPGKMFPRENPHSGENKKGSKRIHPKGDPLKFLGKKKIGPTQGVPNPKSEPPGKNKK